MIDLTWRIDDEDRDTALTGAPRPLLGTWHYLRTSLRRRRLTWVAAAVLGGLLGLASVVLLPPSSKATTTLLMVHPANLDPSSAMTTDLSLLNTRVIATRTVEALGLDLAPEDFQATISSEPVTNEILKISVSAPKQSMATTRADTLARLYLQFRAEQLRSMSSGAIDGLQKRIDTMRKQVAELNRDYTVASTKGEGGQEEAADILTRRAQLNAQVVDLEQEIEDTALNADAAVASTHVIDPAVVVSKSAKRAAVLNTATGLVAGTALGVGFVLFRALTSTQLRRREDVAVALRTPVRLSVRSPGPREGRGRLRSLVRGRAWRGRDREALALGLGSALQQRDGLPAGPGDGLAAAAAAPEGVALAAIGNPRAGAAVVGGLAEHLCGLGRSVLLVDLSPKGSLVRWARRASRRSGGGTEGKTLHVHRPEGVLGLARGPLSALGNPAELDESLVRQWAEADVVLVLADVDPGVDAENLGSWVHQVVPLVTAGASTPELLQTTAELLRTARLSAPFALMLGAHETDESLGLRDGTKVSAHQVAQPVGSP